jgi:hypothetical protein
VTAVLVAAGAAPHHCRIVLTAITMADQLNPCLCSFFAKTCTCPTCYSGLFLPATFFVVLLLRWV